MNLILGAVARMEFEAIAPFLHSLEQTGFEGRVAFFAAGTTERTRELLQQHSVRLMFVEEATLAIAPPINSLRYFIYQRYLSQCGEDYDNILLTDVRDVYFQRDPFTFEIQGLSCFLEDYEMTLSRCPVNSGWIAAAYGNETLAALRDKPVSCSGTTIGPAEAVREYIRAMTAGLIRADERVTNIMHAIHGIDQAVHNYLIHTGTLPGLRLYSNEDGPVLTLNYVPADEVAYDGDGRVLNRAGEVAHVIHQYDRHPALAARLLGDQTALRN